VPHQRSEEGVTANRVGQRIWINYQRHLEALSRHQKVEDKRKTQKITGIAQLVNGKWKPMEQPS
jgi:hypothetical protein